MSNNVLIEIKTPRTNEQGPESMIQFFTGLAHIKPVKSSSFFGTFHPVTLEILLIDQTVHFYVTAPALYQSFIESQLLAQYPTAQISISKIDPLEERLKDKSRVNLGRLSLQSSYAYPLKTFTEFKDVDPLSSLLGLMSKLLKDDLVLVQIALVPAGNKWQAKTQQLLESKSRNKEEDPLLMSTYSKQISEKIAYAGFKVGIKLLASSDNPSLLDQVAACFLSLNKVNGNSLVVQKPYFWQKDKFLKSMLERDNSFIPAVTILNLAEIATLYHFPHQKLAGITNLSWAKIIVSEAPENLPVSTNLSDDEKKDINFFAKTEFKNSLTNFGVLKEDRRKHIYIIGKTGTGKSTLIANMAINDIRNGNGLAIIDPHGDLSSVILDYIPSFRVNDIVYLDPSETAMPFHLNPLEVDNVYQKELVASGIVSIFNKLYGHSWGPRLEYILRNTLLTLVQIPNSTLLQVPEILTNQKFRKKVVSQINDQVLINFWTNEFERMTPQLMSESISPILNKVGQFISSPVIRNIIGTPKSTVNLEQCMNQGKIVIINLSQGKIGEDNSALLGAMLITKMQLAAMNRVNVPEEERKDFYLYVDEFQNFATTSFIKILSEARKYRLDLILANQYIGQIAEDVRLAIFGNAGTMITFVVGASDSPYLAKEYGEKFKQEDILALGKYQIIIKMCIDGLTSSPFMAYTLPLPQSRTQNKEKVLKVSRERYNRILSGKEQKDGNLLSFNFPNALSPLPLNSKEIFRRTMLFLGNKH